MSGDSRKDFILKIIGNCFPSANRQIKELFSSLVLNNFLDNGSCLFLSVTEDDQNNIQLSNDVAFQDKEISNKNSKHLLLFYKRAPSIITPDNLYKDVLVSSMLGSPIRSLYHSLHQIYAPLLLKDKEWSLKCNQTLQKLICDLEIGLGSFITGQPKSDKENESSLAAILSVEDELQFWSATSKSSKRDKAFALVLQGLVDGLQSLESVPLNDAEDIVDVVHNALDDLWRVDTVPAYPQDRMTHLMQLCEIALSAFMQLKLKDVEVWTGNYISVEEALNSCLDICSKWCEICQKLTSTFWSQNSEHKWQGPAYTALYLSGLSHRLQKLLELRTLHHQLTRLLSNEEQNEVMKGGEVFAPFSKLNAVQFNPYTEPIWQMAVQQFVNNLQPAEKRVASKLRTLLHHSSMIPLQLLQDYKRYSALIKLPYIKKEITAERTLLLGQLILYVKSSHKEFTEMSSSGNWTASQKSATLSEVVHGLIWASQFKAKCDDVIVTSQNLLDDLPDFEKFLKYTKDFLDEIKSFQSELFGDWSREIQDSIKSNELSLATDKPVMSFNKDKQMIVTFNPRLVSLIREVRQLALLGFSVPPKIQETAEQANKYSKQAKELQQISNFHNTIGYQMIPSQRPMMLEAAIHLEKLVSSQTEITWNSPAVLEKYIKQLQESVERLSRENRKLRNYHTSVCEKVLLLMETDLLRQQQQWKEGLLQIRNIMSTVEQQGYSAESMKTWKLHWDMQLYKALEYQYQLGLEVLHENLPEIHVELTYRQQRLQFRPPLEEIKSKYYGQMKRFLNIPYVFKGVNEFTIAENSVFSLIVDRNAHRFTKLYDNAHSIFQRLEELRDSFKDWIVFGSLNMEEFYEKNILTVEDWDRSFRAIKAKSQEAGKIANEQKVDCILVNFSPIKAVIDDQIQGLWDTLKSVLRESILKDYHHVNGYVKNAMESLSMRPQTVEEISVSNCKWKEYASNKGEVFQIFEKAEAKNKLMGLWVKEKVELLSDLKSSWDSFEQRMEIHNHVIQKQVEDIKANMGLQLGNFLQEVEKFSARWNEMKPKDDRFECDKIKVLEAIAIIKEKKQEFESLMQTQRKIVSDYEQFGMEVPKFEESETIGTDIERVSHVWFLFEEFNSGLLQLSNEEWILVRNKTYILEEFLAGWDEKLQSSKEQMGTLAVWLLQEVAQYKALVPILKYCRGDHFSTEHWAQIFQIIGMPSNTSVEKLTFGNFLDAKDALINNIDLLKELNNRAQGEISIRQALGELDAWGMTARFTLMEYQDNSESKTAIIKDWKDLLNKVSDNQSLLQSLQDSPYYKLFADRASLWEKRLVDLDSHLHNLQEIQRKWVYLEPIFGRGALAKEQFRFKRINDDFRNIMADVLRNNLVVSLCSFTDLKQTLETLRDQLQRCQKSLNEFLEEKRSTFPRFYFIADDDLLEILGQSTNPNVIQTHLKKLFAAIHTVVFDETLGSIVSVKSAAGEVVALSEKVAISKDVECWLQRLGDEMKSTLKQLLVQCVADGRSNTIDPNRYPQQVLCLAQQILFTERCEEAIQNAMLNNYLADLKSLLNLYTSASALNDDVNIVSKLKLKALILDTIQAISVVEQLLHAHTFRLDDWQWLKQLRFYMKGNMGVVKMVDAEFEYTYEYQGNAPKLVHTPLTDKCFLTLTQGVRVGLGGNPFGPAGTGKTESVKALGSQLGRQVIVFNCDEGIDVKSMGRIFIGIVKCGAWGCFDEFNRLEERVLSAVSTQIQSIQASLKNHLPTTQLLGKSIPIDSNCGLFITLNPMGKGYGGRQKLPDNLKQLFRPVMMSVPDNELIAEVLLFADGYKYAKSLGRKLVSVFKLSKELLTPQQHYDWGLRALKTVLRGCGKALQHAKLNLTDEEKLKNLNESELVVQALRVNTLSKLTFSDCRRFNSLVVDVFPDTRITDFTGGILSEAIKTSFEDLGLTPMETQVQKVIELHEQLEQRMGVVIVGPSQVGKSTIWKILLNALGRISVAPKFITVNPKAMPKSLLLGQIDTDTREWTDGVLTNGVRQAVKETYATWIICDGDIDPEWIESLNSVLDDNHLLTMPSGERIQIDSNVNFIFETDSLSCASPATVSRVGVIHVSNDDDTFLRALVSSWIQCQPDDSKDLLNSLMDEFFYRAVHWVHNQTEFVLETSMEGIAQCALRQLEGVSDRSQFVVSLVKGLGCTLLDAGRESLAKELFTWTGETCPDNQNPLNCYFDTRKQRLEVFHQQAAAELTIDMLRDDLLPLMRTAEVQRYMHHILPWLQSDSCTPFLLVGPEGCGKSLLLHHCFQMLKSAQVVSIQCSAQTGADQVLHKLHQVCVSMSTNCGRVFRPKDSSRLILYLKDLNLPKADAWGTCQLIAFLQQIVTYNGFYDFNLEWVGLDRIQIVGSLTNSGSLGRQTLSTRFTSIVNVCPISYPEKQNLEAICECYLQPICAEALKNRSLNCHQLSRVMVALYNNVRNKFTTDDYSHYVFTPRDLIRWILALNRYDMRSLLLVNFSSFLEAFTYEGVRIFGDRLVSKESQRHVHSVLASLLETEVGPGSISLEDVFYVSWGAGSKSSGAPIPPFGKALGKLAPDDLQKVVHKGIVQFSREQRELNLVIIREVLCLMSQLDRIFGLPGGSVVLIGPSGVGRRSLVSVVANMHGLNLFTLTLFPGYGIKHFRNELKSVMQVTGIEGQQVVLLLEDYQLVDPAFLEMIGGLVSSGEVPGLYTPEELESLIGPLRDLAAQEGFRGSPVAYFTSLVKKNVHVALLMESNSPDLGFNLERFPALHKACCVVWLHEWSSESMRHVAEVCLQKELNEDLEVARKLSGMFVNVHQSMGKVDNEQLPKGVVSSSVPRKYMAFLATYCQLLRSKKDVIVKRKSHLEVGVGKLDEAKAVVGTLKDEAAKSSVLLEEKRAEADEALNLITNSMQNASEQKTEMETLREETLKENEKLAKRKKAIDAELSEIEPLINEAKAAVGNIKTESLSEIRSLRAPPDTIRDILEAVLRLMGIFDTSWNNMKSFLAKRGIKEEICSFDACKISPDIRENVEELLKSRRDSFDPKNAKRASVAAAPLAAWVQANVRYSKVLEKIKPLEQEQSKLKKNLSRAESRMGRLSSDMDNVDKYVSDLRDQLNRSTKEAAEIEIKLQKANETIKGAEALVTGLESEHRRWSLQVKELDKEFVELPSQTLAAAACITYLADTDEDTRSKLLQHIAGLGRQESSFDLLKFLSSEKELLRWRKEGLPSDRSSSENALIILQTTLSPFLIDPSSRATEWLKIHLRDKKFESVNQKDANFMTVLEHAVRFGKTLIIQEVEVVEPVLFPLLRKDLVSMGPRYVVHIGDKVVDFNENFKLLLTTRNAKVEIPTFAQSVITIINFSTTRTGLFRQLIEKALMHEKPELEKQRSDLLRQEEELKLQLNHLEDSLLEQLVNAQGNILDNRELLSSLNKTKASSATAAKSLEESLQLQENLEKERNVYEPLAEFGSMLYFVLADMVKMSNMYSFSLDSFLKIFNKALKISHAEEDAHTRIKKLMVRLQNLVYEYVARSIFKCDQLMLALHLVHGMYPRLFEPNEWEAFTGVLVTDLKADQIGVKDAMPSWINADRSLAFVILKTVFPGLYQKLKIEDSALWRNFSTSMHCEREIPAPVSENVSSFQKVLIVQALRPDRLSSAMTRFACKSLGLRELSPSALNLKALLKETNSQEPILVIVSPGTDPTQELFEVARSVIGEARYHQMAMGQGQAEVAVELLRQCSSSGDWLCLNNLHLVTGWLPILEKELKNLTPQEGFRLWLTTEPHDAFPTVLLQSCLKVAYEAPPGIKRNLQRTFESWSPDFFAGSGLLTRSRALFSLAWFHAIIQERRRFIPQGWTKFYEFSYADLQAASDIVDRFCTQQGSRKQSNRWESVRGLFENAVYGGRIDSPFDIRVLSSYLEGFFNSKLETEIPIGNSSFLKDVHLPNSTSYKDFKDIVDKLSDIDDPTCFGLPANVERAVQKSSSSFAIAHLRILMRSDDIAQKFERDKWHTELSPILNLWKKLNQGSQMVKMQLSNLAPTPEDQKPVHSFVQLEFFNCVKLVQLIHHSLAALSRVIRGTKLLTRDVHTLATSLLQQETPDVWQNEWNGPLEPVPYLRIIMFKSMSVGHWLEKCQRNTLFNDKISLSELFHASTFLHALQHQTAREMKGELDNLKLVASWKGAISGCKLNIQLTGLEIEGCLFDGHHLSENQHSSAIVNSVPPCVIGWIPKASNAAHKDDVIPLAVYSSSERENLVTILEVPCASGEQHKWIQAGVALFLQSPKLV